MKRIRERLMFMGSYFDGLIDLEDDDFVAVTKALLRYMFCDEEPELTGLRKSLFMSFRPVVDISKAKSDAGKEGGSKPKANAKQTESTGEANAKQTESTGEANANEEKRREEKGIEEKGIDEKRREGTAGKPAKHKYGEYQNVLLTDAEREKLVADYGEEITTKSITRLDEYIEEKGTKYKSHYLAIRRWVVDAVKEHMPKHKEETTGNIFLDMYREEEQ